eukprot:scaffold25496_cov130-Isochrysis_galbana.AAC.8
MEIGRVGTSDGWPFVHMNVVRDSTSGARRASSVHVLLPGALLTLRPIPGRPLQQSSAPLASSAHFRFAVFTGDGH